MAKATDMRSRLMDIAEAAVLAKGFGATSIEELITEAGITKGGFFYHFPDKNALARALLVRYLEREEDLLDGIFGRARELHEDPLHAFLIGLKLLAELMDDLPNGHPGCLVATYCYNERLFDRDVRDLYTEALLTWRARFRAYLEEIAERHPPREPVDLDALADMVNNTVEGGIIMSKALRDPSVLGKQVLQLRTYIKLLFEA
ncbi:TetR/AcrR family transcriptional regulator [Martelella sp. FLE1502]